MRNNNFTSPFTDNSSHHILVILVHSLKFIPGAFIPPSINLKADHCCQPPSGTPAIPTNLETAEKTRVSRAPDTSGDVPDIVKKMQCRRETREEIKRESKWRGRGRMVTKILVVERSEVHHHKECQQGFIDA